MAGGLDKVTFNFAKTLSGSYADSLDEITKMLPKFDLPQPVVSQMLEAVETRRHLSPADFAPRLQTATEEAVAIAEVESVAEVIDDAVGEIERMSPTQARQLALDLAVQCLSRRSSSSLRTSGRAARSSKIPKAQGSQSRMPRRSSVSTGGLRASSTSRQCRRRRGGSSDVYSGRLVGRR
jgi:hypothetical protein